MLLVVSDLTTRSKRSRGPQTCHCCCGQRRPAVAGVKTYRQNCLKRLVHRRSARFSVKRLMHKRSAKYSVKRLMHRRSARYSVKRLMHRRSARYSVKWLMHRS